MCKLHRGQKSTGRFSQLDFAALNACQNGPTCNYAAATAPKGEQQKTDAGGGGII
jgi:hypothetical protein